MIVDQKELVELAEHLEWACKYDFEGDWATPSPESPVFFANRPHLLLPLGFDEFRSIKHDSTNGEPDNEFATLPFPIQHVFEYESFYRGTGSGAWSWFEGVSNQIIRGQGDSIDTDRPQFHFINQSDQHTCFPADELFRRLKSLSVQPDFASRSLHFSNVWAPKFQQEQEASLAVSTRGLLHNLAQSGEELRDVPWRKLEEIVAELLRSVGMKIYVTPRSHDGGRDIIARSELVPGEPLLIAVEVKQKPVVGIADVQRALHANKEFPALMIATAGTFSAGVVRERDDPGNKFRLFLKDGVALKDWIASYARRVAERKPF